MVAPRVLPTGIFLHPYGVTFELLRKLSSYFGYNPRQCFDASCSVTRLKATMRQVLRKINGIAINMISILQVLHSSELALSDTIFQISPTNELRQLEICHCDAASQWASGSLLNACETHVANAAAQLYRRFSGIPWAESFRGHLSEWHIRQVRMPDTSGS